MNGRKVTLLANTDWYLYHFRLSLAEMLRADGYEVVLLSPEGIYGPRLREMGFRWQIVPMQRRSLGAILQHRNKTIAWLQSNRVEARNQRRNPLEPRGVGEALRAVDERQRARIALDSGAKC